MHCELLGLDPVAGDIRILLPVAHPDAALASDPKALKLSVMNSADPFKSGNPLPPNTPDILDARFAIGDVVRHRIFDFRGVVYDIDPVFANSDEWYEAIPKDLQPQKDQPFYHLFAENADSSYVAYVSQQNLLSDDSGEPIGHPDVARLFQATKGGKYKLHRIHQH